MKILGLCLMPFRQNLQNYEISLLGCLAIHWVTVAQMYHQDKITSSGWSCQPSYMGLNSPLCGIFGVGKAIIYFMAKEHIWCNMQEVSKGAIGKFIYQKGHKIKVFNFMFVPLDCYLPQLNSTCNIPWWPYPVLCLFSESSSIDSRHNF